VNEKRFRVQREREFAPHHILIGASKLALESAELKTPGWLYYELTAITFSALSLEAPTNSFGEKFVARWCDYESSSPKAKLRIICSRLNVGPDFGKDPWAATLWLVKSRNKVAHARPESINFDKTMTDEDFQKICFEFPQSKLEMQISLENAKRSVSALDEIMNLFYPKLTLDEKNGLYFDGYSGNTSSC
jgi:hypothetical protein